mmetsp:Transcript_9222/g.20000  ORF Transcript_9222/g.20000 Transcript_9222/m.20000 type:complete len:169 (-) Transcript_9222:1402-1908(-)
MAALEAIQTSSRSNDGCVASLLFSPPKRPTSATTTLFHRRQPNTVPSTCTTSAMAEKRRHAGPMDRADDRLAATPIEAKNDRKKKSLHTEAALEKGVQKSLSLTNEFRIGATMAIAAQAVPGTNFPRTFSIRFAPWTIRNVEINSGTEARHAEFRSDETNNDDVVHSL